MYYWLITFTVIQLQSSLIRTQDFSGYEDPGNYMLLMDNHGQRSESGEIEARRRSALDKNFMRFGRSSFKSYTPDEDISLYKPHDENDLDEYHRLRRGKNDGFIRFGRTPDVDFIRFGRSNGPKLTSSALRPVRDGKLKNFIRFGKRQDKTIDYLEDGEDVSNSEEPKRFKRNAEFTPGTEKKRNANDRASNYIRFGRSDNFMRFGRNPVDLETLKSLVANEMQKDSKECPICNLRSYLNPLLSRYPQFPMWIQPQQEDGQFDDKHKKDKKLNTIRFG